MEPFGFIVAFLAVTSLGFLAGVGTGLAPGLHVNNVAILLLATQESWTGFVLGLAPDASPPGAAVLLASLLMATAVSHAIFDFVPSVFLGAPSEESALSLLPGHRLLFEGRGAAAVALAARGAFLGALLCVAILVPLRLLLGDPIGLFAVFRPFTATFFVGLLIALLASEIPGKDHPGRRIGGAILVQALAGTLGVAALRGSSGLPGDVVLFPLFTGLFGLPGLFLAARAIRPEDRPQRLEPLARLRLADAVDVVRGTLSGAAVSWLPTLSGGSAATLATLGSRRLSADRFMSILGATATSTTILSVAVLFVIGRARSGVASAIEELVGSDPQWDPWAAIPTAVVVPLGSALLAAAVAAPVAIWMGRRAAASWSRFDSRIIARATLVLLGVLLAALSGPAGIVLAGVACLVGSLPLVLGVRRVHLMASLLLPALLSVHF